MSSSCLICEHPQRAAIDALLAERAAGVPGLSYAAIAKQYTVVKSSLQRHDAHRMPDSSQAEQAPPAASDAASEASGAAEAAEAPETPAQPTAIAQQRYERAVAARDAVAAELHAAQELERERAARTAAAGIEVTARVASYQHKLEELRSQRDAAHEAALDAAAAVRIAAQGAAPAEIAAATEAEQTAARRVQELEGRLAEAEEEGEELERAAQEQAQGTARQEREAATRAAAELERLRATLAALERAVAAADAAWQREVLAAIRSDYAAALAEEQAGLAHAAAGARRRLLEEINWPGRLARWPTLAESCRVSVYGAEADRPDGAVPAHPRRRAALLAGDDGGGPAVRTLDMDVGQVIRDVLLPALARNAGRRAQDYLVKPPSLPGGGTRVSGTDAHVTGLLWVLRFLGQREGSMGRVFTPGGHVGATRSYAPLGRLARLLDDWLERAAGQPDETSWSAEPEAEDDE